MLICALRVHQFSRRFDDLCESIHKAADLGVEYWLLDSKDGMPALEARIVGHQQLITKSLDSLGARLRRSERRDWAALLAPFIDILSGDEFMERDPEPNPARAKQVQYEMAELVAKITELQTESLKIHRMLRVIF